MQIWSLDLDGWGQMFINLGLGMQLASTEIVLSPFFFSLKHTGDPHIFILGEKRLRRNPSHRWPHHHRAEVSAGCQELFDLLL